jgi:hypothetical protein
LAAPKIPIEECGLGVPYRQILSPDERLRHVPSQAQHLEYIVVQAPIEEPLLIEEPAEIVVFVRGNRAFMDPTTAVDLDLRQSGVTGPFIVAQSGGVPAWR